MTHTTFLSPDTARDLNAPLATIRLQLEPMTAAHADALFAPLQDAAIYDWISAKAPGSAEILRRHWGRNECRLSPDGDEAWLNWAVRRTSDGAYVGTVDVNVDDAKTATNVGYTFFPAYWGQGLATEAVVAVVNHLIGRGILRLVATVTVGNAASRRVLAKAGFTFTRVLTDNDMIRGVVHDDDEYVRTVHPN
ncbi:MAG: GNAT family N-acetyltransferase [Candidatus Sericytochromatia bacterium]|nr:GNAT family N-acetyltransferase [Candidatus Sericytochromatia bacterium]